MNFKFYKNLYSFSRLILKLTLKFSNSWKRSMFFQIDINLEIFVFYNKGHKNQVLKIFQRYDFRNQNYYWYSFLKHTKIDKPI